MESASIDGASYLTKVKDMSTTYGITTNVFNYIHEI